jgi:RecB family endonuclease NucS
MRGVSVPPHSPTAPRRLPTNALRANIDQLEPGLTVIDGGNERKVASGFIDITARDRSGATVVIELKKAGHPIVK